MTTPAPTSARKSLFSPVMKSWPRPPMPIREPTVTRLMLVDRR